MTTSDYQAEPTTDAIPTIIELLNQRRELGLQRYAKVVSVYHTDEYSKKQ